VTGRRVVLLAALAAVPAEVRATAGARADDAAPSFPIVHERLANGLEVVLHADPTVTTAVVVVRYHVGSKDESAGGTGFAHLFEHLMFEGSKHVGAGRFDQLLEAAGGWNNGSTSGDATEYIEQVPANQLALALWLEADRMAGLWDAMNQQVLDQQRDVVKNERRESYENQPYGMASLALQEALWPEGHGYHHPTIGSMADLSAASLADVEAFWRRWYVPSNATLVIAGGIDVAATRALVRRYFGWMPAQARPEGRRLEGEVARRARASALTATDRVQAAKVTTVWRTAAPFTDDATALAVAAQLLGGGRTSRLYRRLVMTDRLASEVYASLSDQTLGGELQIDAIARQGVDVARLRDAIAEEVDGLRTKPATSDEVVRARRVLEADRLAGLENLSSRAEAIAEWTERTGDPDHLAEELAALRAVDARRVRAAAQRWLRADASVTMTVLPEQQP